MNGTSGKRASTPLPPPQLLLDGSTSLTFQFLFCVHLNKARPVTRHLNEIYLKAYRFTFYYWMRAKQRMLWSSSFILREWNQHKPYVMAFFLELLQFFRSFMDDGWRCWQGECIKAEAELKVLIWRKSRQQNHGVKQHEPIVNYITYYLRF